MMKRLYNIIMNDRCEKIKTHYSNNNIALKSGRTGINSRPASD